MPLDELRFDALGATCHLLGIGLHRGALASGAAWVSEMHERLSRFIPESELSRLNASRGAWFEVSPELAELLGEALRAHDASCGLVHAGVLSSMLTIGYTRPLKQGATAPAPAEAAPPPPLPEMLHVASGRARLMPGTGIDLGGIAKGWMADRLARELGANCTVNLGGDLYARGGGPEGEGWPVGLGGVTVMLRDQGAATSGTSRRSWEHGGERLHHLIDPRTGRPARSDLEEVSVVAATGCDAEVVAKTALLLGPGLATAYCAAHAQAWWLQ